MPIGSESIRIVIAGAASLLGKDLKSCLEERAFPVGEIRLVDEELAAGTLTEVGGEPAVIQAVDDATFDRVRFAFFAGSTAFASRYGAVARRAGATVINLAGGMAGGQGARPWIPQLDGFMSPPAAGKDGGIYLSPSAPTIVGCLLSAAFSELSPVRLAIVFLHPVSERGQAGVDELEGQAGKLLSFQPMPQEIFDTQVAFNLLDRWGPGSSERLSDTRVAIRTQVAAYLSGRTPVPAITLVQAPVFYGHAFSMFAEFPAPCTPELLGSRLGAAGFKVLGVDDPGPSNLAVAGEMQPLIGLGEPDVNIDHAYWFWGAADNLRLTTTNAVHIAERLLAS